jgi:hypothetical protein
MAHFGFNRKLSLQSERKVILTMALQSHVEMTSLQWMATEHFVAEIHSGNTSTPCTQSNIDFFTHSASIAFAISGSDRWSYRVQLRMRNSTPPHGNMYHQPDVTFLPQSSVDEPTSNRLVIRNVIIADMSLFQAGLSLQTGPSPSSHVYIRSWVLVVNPSDAANHFTGLLRKVCKEISLLNKVSFCALQVCCQPP